MGPFYSLRGGDESGWDSGVKMLESEENFGPFGSYFSQMHVESSLSKEDLELSSYKINQVLAKSPGLTYMI